ncbi:GNAT family N-acetyltransferase [Pedobacter sp. SYP-B3415]|uniref:GNAT family N-acetyltransferase n=1 Tax=Pedobacter sp. SYP-B3415 TaxID=2496641 RepID=UPI00101C920E|nr:GNAT family N-acetyltransferase [Pedobacter sp. SYP-B3415]
MQPEVKLRAARNEDIPALIELYVQTVLTVCVNEYDGRQLELWAGLGKHAARWEERIAGQYFLVAEVKNSLGGFGSITPGNYLDVFYVHKDHQGLGIASRLYTALMERARKNTGTTVTADVSKTARPFFERKGFVVTRENQNLLEDVVIVNYRMEKALER